MIIKRVYLTGFGKLTQRTFEFEPGLNVLYGLNESGKSSLMEAMKALFYGFYKPGLKRAVLETEYEKYRPWQGNSYGGFIEYEINGECFRLQRSFDRPPLQVQISSLKRDCEITAEFTVDGRGEPQVGLEHLGLNKYMFVNTCWIGQGTLTLDKDFGPNLKDQLTSGLIQSEEIGFLAARQSLHKALQEVGSDGASKKPVAFWRERLVLLRQERQAVIQRQDELSAVLTELRGLEEKTEQLRDNLQQKEEAYQRRKHERLGYRWREINKVKYEIDFLRSGLLPEAQACQRAWQAEGKFEELWQNWRGSKALEEQAETQLVRINKLQEKSKNGVMADDDLVDLLTAWQELQWEFPHADEADENLSNTELKLALMTEPQIAHLLALEERIDRLRLQEQGGRKKRGYKTLLGPLLLAMLGAAVLLYPVGDLALIPWLPLDKKYLGTGILALASLTGLAFLLRNRRSWSYGLERMALALEEELEKALQDVGVRYPGELAAKWQEARLRQAREQDKWAAESQYKRGLLARRKELEEEIRAKWVVYHGSDADVENQFDRWLPEIQTSTIRNQVDLERTTEEELSWRRECQKHRTAAEHCYRQILNLWGEVGANSEEEFRMKVDRGKKGQKDQFQLAQAEEILSRLLEGDSQEEIGQRWMEAGQPISTTEVPESILLRIAEELEAARSEFAICQAELLRLRGEYRNELKHLGRLEQLEEEVTGAEQELRLLLRQRKSLELADSVLGRVEEKVRARRFPRWAETARTSVDQFSNGRYQELKWTDSLMPQLVAPEEKLILNMEQVSAGTKDMIYLALRFSLADYLGPAMPLFLDDPFVELDKARWEKIAQLLVRTGVEKQIFLFTCHEREKEFLRTCGIPVQELA